MKAVTWQGKRDVRVEEVPDPRIEQPDRRHRQDHLVGDLRLRSAPVRGAGPVHEARRHPGPRAHGHRAGSRVRRSRDIAVGDRVVMPFNISCGHCLMCDGGLQSQCETTQVREQNKGAALFGFSVDVRVGARWAGGVPAGPAGAVRADQGQPGRPGRAVPVPLRHPAHRVAGGGVRGPTRGRHPGGLRVGPGRTVRRPHRQASGIAG